MLLTQCKAASGVWPPSHTFLQEDGLGTVAGAGAGQAHVEPSAGCRALTPGPTSDWQQLTTDLNRSLSQGDRTLAILRAVCPLQVQGSQTGHPAGAHRPTNMPRKRRVRVCRARDGQGTAHLPRGLVGTPRYKAPASPLHPFLSSCWSDADMPAGAHRATILAHETHAVDIRP